MKTFVVYDSQYGNTQKIAQAIAASFHQAKAVRVGGLSSGDLIDLDLLIVGSPTQGGRPTLAIQEFINQLPSLSKINVAAFDTGFRYEDLNFALKILVKTIGYAAPKIAKSLEAKGGRLITPPRTFYIKGKEGPLLEKEIDHASNWIKNIK